MHLKFFKRYFLFLFRKALHIHRWSYLYKNINMCKVHIVRSHCIDACHALNPRNENAFERKCVSGVATFAWRHLKTKKKTPFFLAHLLLSHRAAVAFVNHVQSFLMWITILALSHEICLNQKERNFKQQKKKTQYTNETRIFLVRLWNGKRLIMAEKIPKFGAMWKTLIGEFC